jgi:hypothetical protein
LHFGEYRQQLTAGCEWPFRGGDLMTASAGIGRAPPHDRLVK